MRRFLPCFLAFAALGLVCTQGFGQEEIPTPTPIPINEACVLGGVDNENLLRNGDFQQGLNTSEGQVPSSWQGTGTAQLVVDATQQPSEEELRGLVRLFPGDSISQIPTTNSNYTKFRLKFCALVVNGQIRVKVGSITVLTVPSVVSGSPSVITSSFESDPFPANLTSSGVGNHRVSIEFMSTGRVDQLSLAYIDNVSLLPVTQSDETPEPTEMATPSPEPTPTLDGTPTDTPTSTPTLEAGIHTPTPTPGVHSDSVQLVVNPPMLTVSPDDFASRTGEVGKRISLELQVVGSDGEPINILGKDEDATVEFEIQARGETQDIGTLNLPLEGSGNQVRNITTRQMDLEEIQGRRIYFYPNKAYTGTVQIAVTVEYESNIDGKTENVEIQGVAPIYMRRSDDSSLTNITGTFNPQQNYRLGRKPGDRGYRPNLRTNMLFRERITQ